MQNEIITERQIGCNWAVETGLSFDDIIYHKISNENLSINPEKPPFRDIYMILVKEKQFRKKEKETIKVNEPNETSC